MAAMTAEQKKTPVSSSSHSGSFTVSNLNEENDANTDKDCWVKELPIDSEVSSEVIASEHESAKKTMIDNSFNKLFACMSIAYSTQLTSPRFKAFKGLKVTIRDKMRLNNIIWREWYLQFVRRRQTRISPFNPKVEDTHPKVIVLEGKYWKRKPQVVVIEYMKWRVFHKNRVRSLAESSLKIEELLARVSQQGPLDVNPYSQNQTLVEDFSKAPALTSLDFRMDLTDEIFNTLQSFGFPHQSNRDFFSLENSDFMQPHLLGLEPELDFCGYDSTEPLQDFLADTIESWREYKPGQKRPGMEVTEPLIPARLTMATPPPPPYPEQKRQRILTSGPAFQPPSISVSASTYQTLTSPAPTYQTPTPKSFFESDSQSNTPLNIGGLATKDLDIPVNSVYQLVTPRQTAEFTDAVPDNTIYDRTFYVPNANPVSYSGGYYSSNGHPPPVAPAQDVSKLIQTNTGYPVPAPTTNSYMPAVQQPEFKAPKQLNTQTVGASSNLFEKSVFLTQLLRSPLDRDVSAANVNQVSSTTMHLSDGRPADSVISQRVRPGSSGDSGLQDEIHNSMSAEEDRKESLTTEQKRRQQIKNGLEVLATIIPNLPSTTTSKVSKANMLNKTVEYITSLQKTKNDLQSEIDRLKAEIKQLNDAVIDCQGQLPVTGISSMSQQKDQMKRMLQAHIAEQTTKNWKFYGFSKIFAPLFDSFYTMVALSSTEELFRTTFAWLDQHCSLTTLRPSVMGALRQIVVETSILTDPSKYPEQSRAAALKPPSDLT